MLDSGRLRKDGLPSITSMPIRLWFMLALLCAGIVFGSGFALYIGAQEIRLHQKGPRQDLRAEELDPRTRGWVMVRGCVRHDLEVAVSPDGIIMTSERDENDHVFYPLTPESECDDADAPHGGGVHIKALVDAHGSSNGLSTLYARGYQAPPTPAWVEGIIGFGTGDGRLTYLATRELVRRGLEERISHVPLLVKGRRPGSLGVAWATAVVGAHGLLLLLFLGGMALRRHLRGSMPFTNGEAEWYTETPGADA